MPPFNFTPTPLLTHVLPPKGSVMPQPLNLQKQTGTDSRLAHIAICLFLCSIFGTSLAKNLPETFESSCAGKTTDYEKKLAELKLEHQRALDYSPLLELAFADCDRFTAILKLSARDKANAASPTQRFDAQWIPADGSYSFKNIPTKKGSRFLLWQITHPKAPLDRSWFLLDANTGQTNRPGIANDMLSFCGDPSNNRLITIRAFSCVNKEGTKFYVFIEPIQGREVNIKFPEEPIRLIPDKLLRPLNKVRDLRVRWEGDHAFAVNYVYRESYKDEILDSMLLARVSIDRYGVQAENYATTRSKRARKAE
jgi:hypothetical protein